MISLEIRVELQISPAFRPVKALGLSSEEVAMDLPAGAFTRIDALFPYVCFVYGVVVTLVLSSDALNRIADERLPGELVARWRSHRSLALFCLVAGAFWIVQNLWLT